MVGILISEKELVGHQDGMTEPCPSFVSSFFRIFHRIGKTCGHLVNEFVSMVNFPTGGFSVQCMKIDVRKPVFGWMLGKAVRQGSASILDKLGVGEVECLSRNRGDGAMSGFMIVVGEIECTYEIHFRERSFSFLRKIDGAAILDVVRESAAVLEVAGAIWGKIARDMKGETGAATFPVQFA